MSQVLSRLMQNKFAHFFLGFGLIQFLSSISVMAQVVPDRTLQNNSQVTVNEQTIEITGGTQNGSHLFHSFEQFSIPTGNTAYFNNGLDIENIFSRVTGSSTSNIDGLIQANGTANLFLINPHGIIFGQNARLNTGGSFLGSTAESMVWENGFFWSATNPHPAPLLNINLPIGLQIGATPGDIVVQGQPIEQAIATNIETPQDLQGAIEFQQSILNSSNGLQVQPGKTLALLGGNVILNSGLIKTSQGRIELGSLQSEGFVGLTFNTENSNGNLILDYNSQDIPQFGQIQILDQATAIASGEGGGDIQIVGSNLLITNGSKVIAGTLGTQGGGNINVRTSDSVELVGNSPEQQNGNLLGAGTYGSGNSGNLTIDTGRLIIQDGSVVGSGSFAVGNGSEVIVRASDSVDISGIAPNGQASVIAAIAQGTTGNAGDVTIETGQLMLRDGGQVGVSTFGSGEAGNLTITAGSKVFVIGRSPNTPVASGLVAETHGTGDAGNLTINTGQLIVQDGGIVGAGTFAAGDGGEVMIQAGESVEISGIAPNAQNISSDASFIGAIAQSTGNAGNILIETGQLIVRDGARVAVNTMSAGEAGNLTIRARDNVQILGRSRAGQLPSELAAETYGTGNAGNITLETGQLIVRDGAQVTLDTYNQGQAGTLLIQARDKVQVIDAPVFSLDQLPPVLAELLETLTTQNQPNLTNLSNLTNNKVPTIRATAFSNGNAGNITIETRQLIVQDGGAIFVGTFADGQGGNLRIDASESVEVFSDVVNPLSIQGLGAATFSTGNAGNVTIDTARFVVRDGGEAVVGTFADGNAGTLNITASDSVEVVGSTAVDPTTYADGQKPSSLLAETKGAGNAGNVIVNTQQLLVSDGGIVTVNGEATGNPGSIDINANEIFLNDRGSLAATSATGQGGNIRLRSPDIQLRRGSHISASGSQTGNVTLEGNIDLNTEILVLLEGSQIITNAADPRGGSNITIGSIDGSELVVFQSADSLINADGKLEVDTEVDINQPVIYEVKFNDVTQLISRGCEAIAQGSQFTITGRGGLPANPGDLLSLPRSMVEWTSREDLTFSQVNPQDSVNPQFPETSHARMREHMSDRIIEATGFIVADDGTVQLVADSNSFETGNFTPITHPNCQQ